MESRLELANESDEISEAGEPIRIKEWHTIQTARADGGEKVFERVSEIEYELADGTPAIRLPDGKFRIPPRLPGYVAPALEFSHEALQRAAELLGGRLQQGKIDIVLILEETLAAWRKDHDANSPQHATPATLSTILGVPFEALPSAIDLLRRSQELRDAGKRVAVCLRP